MNTSFARSLPRRRMLCALGVLTLGICIPLRAAPSDALNVDRNGLAVQGYDPVAFFTSPKPVKGLPSITTTRDGATYRFATAEHKAAFDANPAKYEPAFGGYCAYGVSKGKKVEVDVDAFQIVNGRLLLQYSKGVREKFNQDTQGNLKLADAKWPDVSKLPK